MLDTVAKIPLKDADLFRQANYIDGTWVQADSGKPLKDGVSKAMGQWKTAF